MAFEISFQSLIFSDLMAAGFGGVTAAAAVHLWGGLKRNAAQEQRSLTTLLDGSPDAVLQIDAEGSCTFASGASARLLERAPSELVGQSILAFAADDAAAFQAAIARARAGQLSTDVVFRRIRAGGEQCWLEARIGAALPSGHVTIALRDVSTRKTAELALRVANTELNKLAGSDALTGLANRRRFDQMLETECRRSSRTGKPVSLLLLDVDRFKAFNDRHGHHAGDTCLKQIGAALRTMTDRAGDLAARFSGEELALILPGLDEDDSLIIAERVRQAVHGLPLNQKGSAKAGDPVTVSIGCATAWPTPDNLKGVAASLIAGVDHGLYEAKRLGRNRVALASGTSRSEAVTAQLAAERGRLARIEALRASGALNPSPVLHRISRMAAVLLGMPTAFVALLDRNEVTILGSHGLDEEPLFLPYDFCTPLLGIRGALAVPRTAADPRFREVATSLGWASLAAAPLLSGDGLHHIGALWVVDRQTCDPLDEPKRMLLSRLASLVMEDLDARDVVPVALATAV